MLPIIGDSLRACCEALAERLETGHFLMIHFEKKPGASPRKFFYSARRMYLKTATATTIIKAALATVVASARPSERAVVTAAGTAA